MPHLVLEYSGNVRDDIRSGPLLRELHGVLALAGGFRVQDFKGRAVRMADYAIGDGSIEQAFVNLDLRTFAGKSDELKQAISQAALDVLVRAFSRTMAETACDISVQITELDRVSYARARSQDAVTS
ncbi:5-carboxymethyl-2-hydroxymuconate Delta-isomerase [Actinacidiphila sp. ITFR-21]|uniref:5-carboxymethyl-2-hydroxymuconate Delta-isomerase n=1 Tax=Actinacidiphila sp. ITFR-21 TaxID=3075199 RepID=UPI00288AF96D|nr:5-carboxymethyl-2-hydroxymuconate Delta-isomerase [Streptomyces sp. ITFR-21]WNI16062.1 5-carboxymethyl-2-hydroxymuconate Delta-isomerase [Streptomyces sp. ITFR-21]